MISESVGWVSGNLCESTELGIQSIKHFADISKHWPLKTRAEKAKNCYVCKQSRLSLDTKYQGHYHERLFLQCWNASAVRTSRVREDARSASCLATGENYHFIVLLLRIIPAGQKISTGQMWQNAKPELFSFPYFISVFISPNSITCLLYFFSLRIWVFPLRCYWAELSFVTNGSSALNVINRFMLDNDLYLVTVNSMIYECKQVSVGERFTGTFYTQPSILLQTCVLCRYAYARVSLRTFCLYICARIFAHYTSPSISFPETAKSTTTEASIADLSIPLSCQHSPPELLLGCCLISYWGSTAFLQPARKPSRHCSRVPLVWGAAVTRMPVPVYAVFLVVVACYDKGRRSTSSWEALLKSYSTVQNLKAF